MPIPSFKPQFPGMVEHSHKADLQSLLSGRSLFSSQLSQHFLRAGPGAFPVGPAGNPLYSIPSTGAIFSVFNVPKKNSPAFVNVATKKKLEDFKQCEVLYSFC